MEQKHTAQRLSKSILALIFFLGGTIAVLFFSAALHGLLSGASVGIEIVSIGEAFSSLIKTPKHLMLFGCMELLVILVTFGILLINTKTYQSEMMQITPEISTPVPVGQNQHGSAKWMAKKEFDRVFPHFALHEKYHLIRDLVDEGETDLKELKRLEGLVEEKERQLIRFRGAMAAMKQEDYLPEDWQKIERIKRQCEVEMIHMPDLAAAENLTGTYLHQAEMVCNKQEFAETKKAAVEELDGFIKGFKTASFAKQQLFNRLRSETFMILMESESPVELKIMVERIRETANEIAETKVKLDEKNRRYLEKEKERAKAAFNDKKTAIKKSRYDETAWRQLLEIREKFFLYVENATTMKELDDICRFTDERLSRVKTIAMKEQTEEFDFDEEIEWVDSPFAALPIIEIRSSREERGAVPIPKMDGERTKPKQDNTARHIAEGGLVVGMEAGRKDGTEKYYHITGDYHSLCIGATRSGKSRHLVLQSIGSLSLAGETMVISDPKGELFQYTKPYLERLGYDVKVIDFKNPTKSDRYNFLQPVIDALRKGDVQKAQNAVWDITRAMVPDKSHGEKIWQHGEASVIASAIMSVAYDNQEPENEQFQNLTNVYHFISEMAKSVNKTSPMEQYIKDIPENHPARSLLSIADIAPDRTKGSFYTGALTNLRLFTSDYIYNMTYTSDYSPKDLGQRKMALFIVLPDATTTYYSIASLLVSQHYMALAELADELGGRLPVRVNFILDEFGNFTKIDDFAPKLTVAGGRGIRFNLFLQAFSQLEEKYGQESARTIMGNCHTWIYLLSTDHSTNETISGKLGKYTASAYSLSSQTQKYAAPSASQSVNLIERPLLTPDEVGKIKRPYSLILSQDSPAMMYAPDLSKQIWNRLYGLGDQAHNTKVRLLREKYRRQRHIQSDIALWGIWNKYIKQCQEGGRR